MKSVIYHATFDDCSVSFPIMYIMNNQYVLIGPEYKPGIQAAISYKDFLDGVKIHPPKKHKCVDAKCIDMWEALKDNFYFSNVNYNLKCLMSLYFWVAVSTNNMGMIPAPILPLLAHSTFKYKLYIAKMIPSEHLKEDITKSRNVFFSNLGGHPTSIITEKDFSAACYISDYVPNIISKVGIKDFHKTLKIVVKRIDEFAKKYNFLHGKTHIGHISTNGTFIDFGESFNIRELDQLERYMKKLLPDNLFKKALEKAKIHDVDVACACTLFEIYRFIDSVKEVELSREIGAMKMWIIDTFSGYLDADESIFTYMKKDNYVFGGFDFKHVTIKERLPTYYFIKNFLIN